MIWALVLRHWRALSIVAAVIVIAIGMASWRASVYRAGVAAGRAACEAAHTAALEAARAAQAEADREYRRGLADREARIVELNQRLSAPRPDPRVLTREVPTDAPVTACPRRSDDYWRLYNAAARGDPAGEAAPGAVPAPGTDHSALRAARVVAPGDGS